MAAAVAVHGFSNDSFSLFLGLGGTLLPSLLLLRLVLWLLLVLLLLLLQAYLSILVWRAHLCFFHSCNSKITFLFSSIPKMQQWGNSSNNCSMKCSKSNSSAIKQEQRHEGLQAEQRGQEQQDSI